MVMVKLLMIFAFQSAGRVEYAGQKSALGQDLEAVTDADDQSAVRGILLDSRHHWGKLGNRTAAQVVTVGETAGEDDGVHIAYVSIFVPDELGSLPQVLGDGIPRIMVAIASWKYDDTEFHGRNLSVTDSARGEWRKVGAG